MKSQIYPSISGRAAIQSYFALIFCVIINRFLNPTVFISGMNNLENALLCDAHCDLDAARILLCAIFFDRNERWRLS
jgi:hypothetical protein